MRDAAPKLGLHLLGTADLSREQVDYYLDTAETFLEVGLRAVKKVPALRGRTVINLFAAESLHTRVSFEIAAKRLSADAISVSNITQKEEIYDAISKLECMEPDVIVVRHATGGFVQKIADRIKKAAVVNAGDGDNEHPTQALIDALTIKKACGRIDDLVIAYVGRSGINRVLTSNTQLFRLFNCKQRLIIPTAGTNEVFPNSDVEVFSSLEEGLRGADVIILLNGNQSDISVRLPVKNFPINESLISTQSPKAVVLSAGRYNRGVVLNADVYEGNRWLHSQQVRNGVAVHMAVLFLHAMARTDDSRTEGEIDLRVEE